VSGVRKPSGLHSCACATRGSMLPPKMAGVVASAATPPFSTSLLLAIDNALLYLWYFLSSGRSKTPPPQKGERDPMNY
ncbi:MAG: hypothetical protein NW204_05085, partial [Xanthomonadaceae bacterium]|nr:hypothetical protein [Xanthomonadaceae bacterium]